MGKHIDFGEIKKILELLNEGVYPSKIAKLRGKSRQAIHKKLKQMEDMELIKKTQGKPIFYELTDEGKSYGVIENSNVDMSTLKHDFYARFENKVDTAMHSAHKIKLSIPYKGTQPTENAIVKPFGRYKTATQSIYKLSRQVTVVAFKNKLNVWIHNPKGIRTQEQLIKAKQLGYLILLEFSRKHNLKLDGYLDRVLQSHHVIENKNVNETLWDTFSLKEVEERLGSKAGDASHPNKIEHEGRKRPDRTIYGNKMAEGLEYLILDFPKHFGQFSGGLALYDKNIRKHLTVLEQMEQNQKELNKSLKKLNKSLKR